MRKHTCATMHFRQVHKYLYARYFARRRNGFKRGAPTRRDVSDRDTRDSAEISRSTARSIAHGARMIDVIRRRDHESAFFLFIYGSYGERCENAIRTTRERGSTIMTRLLSRPACISSPCVAKLRSFNRRQTWQPVRNDVFVFRVYCHVEIYTRSQPTRQIYGAAKCIRDDLESNGILVLLAPIPLSNTSYHNITVVITFSCR